MLQRRAVVAVLERQAIKDLVVLGPLAASLHLDKLQHLEAPALHGHLLEFLAVSQQLRRRQAFLPRKNPQHAQTQQGNVTRERRNGKGHAK